MKLINNTENNSHYDVMMAVAKESDELIIASPFCFNDFRPFTDDLASNSGIRSVTFITTLKQDELLSKIEALMSFSIEMTAHMIDWKIYIDNRLHGKVYIFRKSGDYAGAIITSANITTKGQKTNHEWGCLTREKNQIESLHRQLVYDTEYEADRNQLEMIMKRVEDYKQNHEIPGQVQIPDIDIDDIVNPIDISAGTRFFIKPVGYTGHKIYDGDYSNEDEQYFSKRRPQSVRKGDILIAYGVGSRKIISAFQVLSGPYNTGKPDDRWPWYFEVRNLTPELGRNWPYKNLFITDIVRKYVEASDQPVTENGGKNLNGLRYGSDKIQLTDEFGRYLFQKVCKENRE